MICRMEKKGVIFTIVAILLVGILIGSAALMSREMYNQKSYIALSRVSSMNDFISSVEQDAGRSLMIAGYRSIISIQKKVSNNATFIANFSDVFEEIMLNGTIDGQAQDLMANASVNDWVKRINEEANKVNINLVIIPISVKTYQKDPWTITIQFNATINVTDFNNLAYWHYNKSFEKDIDIVSFEDPLYTVNSNNKVTNIIMRDNNSDFVDRATNDTANLYNHMNNSFYIASPNAPSFLQRFEGNLSPSPYGIESLVNLVDFSKQSVPTFGRSVIDYEYFNMNYNGTDRCNMPGMPSWFRIDQDRLSSYNLTGLGGSCP